MFRQDDTVLLFEPETGTSLDALIQTVVQLPDYGAAWTHQDGGDFLVPSRWWQLRDAAHASSFLPQQLRVTSTTGIGVRLFTVRIVQVHTGTRDVRRIGRTSPIEMQRFTPPLQPLRYMPRATIAHHLRAAGDVMGEAPPQLLDMPEVTLPADAMMPAGAGTEQLQD